MFLHGALGWFDVLLWTAWMCPLLGQREAGCFGVSASHPVQSGMDRGFAAVGQGRFISCWGSFQLHFEVSVFLEWLLQSGSYFFS